MTPDLDHSLRPLRSLYTNLRKKALVAFWISSCLLLTQTAWSHQYADSVFHSLKTEPLSWKTVDEMLLLVNDLTQRRKYRDAFELVSHAKSVAVTLNYPKGQTYADLYKGILHFWLGNYKQALETSLKVLKEFENVNDQKGVAEVYNLMAKVYSIQGSYTKGIKLQKKSLQLFQEYNDSIKIAACLNNIGVYSFELGKYDQALRYYSRVLKLNLLLKDQFSLGITYNNLGEVYNRQNQPRKALPYLEDALSLATTISDQLILAHANNEKAKAYILLGKYKHATDCLKEGRKVAINAGLRREQLLNLQYTVWLYKEQKQIETAFKWQEQYLALKDSIYNETQSNQMINMQVAYDMEGKDQQISSLQLKTALQEEHYQYNRLLLVGVTLAFILTLSLGVFWWRLSQLRKSTNLSLLKQQQAITRKNKQIQQHTEELTALNESKNRLFSIISHDIRSPLTQLQGILSLFDNNQISQDEFQVAFATINENVNYVNNLIDNLLFWAKSQMGGIKAEHSRFNIKNVINEAFDLLYLQADKKQIALNNCVVDDVYVWADSDMLTLVMRNLLSNAIKFTPKQGQIIVALEERDNEVVVCVQDTGIGIAESRIPKLFTDITESTRGTANEKGTGLGLQMCYEFVTINAGKIWAESESGVGSKFCFTVPMAVQEELKSLET